MNEDLHIQRGWHRWHALLPTFQIRGRSRQSLATARLIVSHCRPMQAPPCMPAATPPHQAAASPPGPGPRCWRCRSSRTASLPELQGQAVLGLHRIEHPIDRVLGHRMASMENVPDPTPGRQTNQPQNTQAKGREASPPSPSTPGLIKSLFKPPTPA